MHRKIWFLVAAAVAVFALTGSVAGSAAAGGHFGYQWKGGMSVAQSLAANRTPAQRAVNTTVNFGMEQDAGGFNLANQDFTGPGLRTSARRRSSAVTTRSIRTASTSSTSPRPSR